MRGDHELPDGLRAVLADDTFARRFEVGDQAGEGGMGRVHRAVDRETGRPIALKVLNATGDEARFALEAETLERMEHPAIVAYVGHGATSSGEAYLAMAWLDGTSLAKRLLAGPLELDDTLAIGIRIASALVHAHALDVVHRDLKPSNVMLVAGSFEEATLIDFGIAKDTAKADGLTSTGQLIGTPGYMAPEQARGVAPAPAMDVFGLGVLLYECLGGRPPFDGPQTVEVLARLLLEHPTPLDELRPGLPFRVVTLIDALLEKDPARRTATARDVELELRAIRDAIARDDRSTLAARPSWVKSPPRSRRPVWIAGAAAISVIAGIAIMIARHETTDDNPAPTVAHDCKLTGTCDAVCEAGDAAACLELGRERYLSARDSGAKLAAIRKLQRGCELGSPVACTLAGTWIRRQVVEGDRSYSRDGWVAMLDRGCTLDAGRACALFAEYLLAESPTSTEQALGLYERACPTLATACFHAAELLVHRDAEGDQARANDYLIEACKRGYTRACK